ncbi:bifunctional tRNA (5-methylaminomethyl-2-thiouridine)(34)-methyltransferase MnmD/FAD-dependent 5-carboxymethylaminomethyl-2-thiouridine(34) oxidoreductase MnmC [Seongchinamella sediminis]|uniref:tRNA 5-methylaminomethyl-2-thiouridine biosynthesis bifunctional protein MnmC n=1 Tax=Seongchinamella sediminis TaxID=2283635 RepID=A0A3L7E2X0_9GAMM|nr:bifunctional tRNA (5-methylaminomethyl-2-thiouridine)(34)-methyltransferase MnmD/FAD-dependent 5-carboxymethylaminomethyl-2-thiouridine(34) oxidoreductase MnmC [Seongchinamella sediminis]RLQ23215.1 bifunctional tRNA (5-methylaminomethyl-2-thiouridine)(34)-methyltransferase MnmD/FAD-dependent 5-carboxymethylaminomethyl-2-thiouridine(34) oxidoreductase MnmC [Seongchinamella sediminis]
MKRDNRPWGATPAATLSWTEDGAPYASDFDDLYYSREDGMAESRHVFLAGNRLPARWQAHRDADFRIAETGFGTGLNFLLSWQAWRQLEGPRPRLHYVAVEKYPLSREDMGRALAAWPELAELAGALLQAWPGRLPGQHRLLLEDGQLVLDLWWEDASDSFADLARLGPRFDAWYLDGFAPARNESMWQPALYQSMAALSRPGATVATFTAAGHVRRGLAAAGFQMAKVPGFGRKRESLAGCIAVTAAAPAAVATPWDLPAEETPEAGSVLIIGAGLAGCLLAKSLADRGLTVQLLDQGELAGEASGNEQGVLYTRLSRKHSALTDFALQSFSHAARRYRHYFASGLLASGRDGALCGSFHQQADADELAAMEESLAGLEGLAQVLDRAGAAEKLGAEPALAGYWYPDSGWLRPPAVCRAMLQSDLIELRENCGPLALVRTGTHWQALNDAGASVASAGVAVLCTGTGSTGFAPAQYLPLQSIRGQTSYLPASDASAGLRAAFCHQGYISPARDGVHCIGASFKLRDSSRELRAAEHRENVDKLATALPAWAASLAQLDPATLTGRVGFRCASPDYLPVVGPLPRRADFLQTYTALRKNAKRFIDARGDYMQGLYINTAHGSRGLSSAPLCAELLASMICREPLPLSSDLCRALSPARFLIRDLARNRL